ncbi:MAG: hypothetical protein ABDH28_06915, partial [Brevinematia bacterium]
LQDSIDKTGKTGKQSFGSLGGIIGGIGGAFTKFSMILAGVVAVIETLKQGIESMLVVKQLEVALQNTGIAGEELKKKLEELNEEASRISGITGIDDETIIKMYQLGIQAGLTTEQTKELAKVAMNVATAFGLDFETAMIQTIRLLTTGETMLTRYDARLKQLIETQASNTEIVEYLAKNYAGMAEEVGKINVIQKTITQFNNLVEQLGITLYPVVSAVLDLANGVLQKLQPALEKLQPVIGIIADGLKELANVITGVFNFVVDNIVKVVDFVNSQIKTIQDNFSPEKRLESIVSDIDRIIRTRPNLEPILEKYATTNARAFVNLNEYTLKTLQSLVENGRIQLDNLSKSALDKLFELYSEYQNIRNQIGKEKIKTPAVKVDIDTKALKEIKRVGQPEGKSETKKQEEDIYSILLKQIQALSRAVVLDKDRKQVSREILELYKQELSLIRQVKINGQEFGEIQKQNAMEIIKSQGEQADKVIQLIDAYRDLEKGIEELAKLLEQPAENTEEWGKRIKQINSDMSSLLSAFGSLASEMGETGQAIQKTLQGVSQLGQALEMSLAGGSTIAIVSTIITGVVGLLGGIVNLFSSTSEHAKEYVSYLEEGNKQLELIKAQLEVIDILQQNLVEGSEAWVQSERQREQMLRSQLEVLKQQLGIQGEINAQDIANRKAQEIQ